MTIVKIAIIFDKSDKLLVEICNIDQYFLILCHNCQLAREELTFLALGTSVA